MRRTQGEIFASRAPAVYVLSPCDRRAAGSPMNMMDTEDLLKAELAHLRAAHRALDDEIAELGLADRLALQRLKKRKLALKDRIAQIKDRLYPDIIA